HKKLKVPTRLPISSGRKFEVSKSYGKNFTNFRHFSSLKTLQTWLQLYGIKNRIMPKTQAASKGF
ncbi:MAG: hypothetical protein ACE5H1_03550, partial [Thermodesulfobacteriota bacterium]